MEEYGRRGAGKKAVWELGPHPTFLIDNPHLFSSLPPSPTYTSFLRRLISLLVRFEHGTCSGEAILAFNSLTQSRHPSPIPPRSLRTMSSKRKERMPGCRRSSEPLPWATW